jgi:hypothetical protein
MIMHLSHLQIAEPRHLLYAGVPKASPPHNTNRIVNSHLCQQLINLSNFPINKKISIQKIPNNPERFRNRSAKYRASQAITPANQRPLLWTNQTASNLSWVRVGLGFGHLALWTARYIEKKNLSPTTSTAKARIDVRVRRMGFCPTVGVIIIQEICRTFKFVRKIVDGPHGSSR